MNPDNPPAATEVLPECKGIPSPWGSEALFSPPPEPCTQETHIQQPPAEVGWGNCAACTLLRVHHKAEGRIHFSASSCSGQQAPEL